MKDNIQTIVTTVCVCICLALGYDKAKTFINTEPNNDMHIIQSISPELENVKNQFNKIESNTDKELIYKLFVGSAEYLNACETMLATNQFDPILGRVQSSYGWKRDKYPAFTDAVSEYLISVGYDKPKALKTADDRKEFAQIFQDLVEAIK